MTVQVTIKMHKGIKLYYDEDIKETINTTFRKVKKLKSDPSIGLIVHNPIEEINDEEIPSEEKMKEIMGKIINRIKSYEDTYKNLTPAEELALRQEQLFGNMIKIFCESK